MPFSDPAAAGCGVPSISDSSREMTVLSFPAVHTLAGCLLAADANAETLGWGSPATLLLIHDRRLDTAGPAPLRAMRGVEFPLHPNDLLTDPAGLPARPTPSKE